MARTKVEVSKRQFVDALMSKVAPNELEEMLKQFGLTAEDTKPSIKASNIVKGYLNSVRKNVNGTKVAIHKLMDLGKTEDIPDEIWYEIEKELNVLAPDTYRAASQAISYEPRVSHGGRPRKVRESEQQPVAEKPQRRVRKPKEESTQEVKAEEKPRRGGRQVGSKNKPKEAVEANSEPESGRKASSTSKGYPPFSEWQKQQREQREQQSRTAVPA